MPDSPLDGATIRRYLEEIAAELEPAGPPRTLVVVGGSLLALHGLRDTTADVDTIERMDGSLRAAVEVVAARHDLAPTWLNDRAAMFRPATFDLDACEVLLDRPALRVLGPPLAVVFVMKLFASRARDFDDLIALWPHTGFSSAEGAVAAYEAAYPHEQPDPYLVDHIQQIADLAKRRPS